MVSSSSATQPRESRNCVRRSGKSWSIAAKEAASLRGRMVFAEGQLFGRTGKLCIDVLSSHAEEGSEETVSDEEVVALSRFASMLQSNKGRCISSSAGRHWTLFTDACYEPSSATWTCGMGAILISPDGIPAACFSRCLTKKEMEAIGSRDKKSIIFEAEMLAMLLALRAWRAYFGHSPILVFIDNNSARDVAISGKTRGKIASRMLECLMRLEDECAIWPWFSRVPSESNPADLPSRELCTQVSLRGRTVKATCVDSELAALFKDMKLDG